MELINRVINNVSRYAPILASSADTPSCTLRRERLRVACRVLFPFAIVLALATTLWFTAPLPVLSVITCIASWNTKTMYSVKGKSNGEYPPLWPVNSDSGTPFAICLLLLPFSLVFSLAPLALASFGLIEFILYQLLFTKYGLNIHPLSQPIIRCLFSSSPLSSSPSHSLEPLSSSTSPILHLTTTSTLGPLVNGHLQHHARFFWSGLAILRFRYCAHS